MAVMLGNFYGALRDAGASDDSSRKVAGELARFDSRFGKIKTDLAVLKWMLGLVLASMLGGFATVIRLLVD